MKKSLFVLMFVLVAVSLFISCSDNVASKSWSSEKAQSFIDKITTTGTNYIRPLRSRTDFEKFTEKTESIHTSGTDGVIRFGGKGTKGTEETVDYITFYAKIGEPSNSSYTSSTKIIEYCDNVEANITSYKNALNGPLVEKLDDEDFDELKDMLYNSSERYYSRKLREIQSNQDSIKAMNNSSTCFWIWSEAGLNPMIKYFEKIGKSKEAITSLDNLLDILTYYFSIGSALSAPLKGDVVALELATRFADEYADELNAIFDNNMSFKGVITAKMADEMIEYANMFDKINACMDERATNTAKYLSDVFANIE